MIFDYLKAYSGKQFYEFFEKFTNPMFAELLKTIKLVKLEKGQKLYNIGDSADFYYYVLEGSLLLCNQKSEQNSFF